MGNHLNVFQGPDAVRDLLDPSKIPNLPLVELPASLNPYVGEKLMNLLPLGNVKAVPAFKSSHCSIRFL